MDVRLLRNQSENSKHNLISGLFNKILKKKFSVCREMAPGCQKWGTWGHFSESNPLFLLLRGPRSSIQNRGVSLIQNWEQVLYKIGGQVQSGSFDYENYIQR